MIRKIKEIDAIAQDILKNQSNQQFIFINLDSLEPVDMENKLFDANCARNMSNLAFETIVEKQVPHLMKIVSDAIKSEVNKGNTNCDLEFEEFDQIYLATYQKVKKSLDELGYKVLSVRYTKSTSKNLLLKTKICW